MPRIPTSRARTHDLCRAWLYSSFQEDPVRRRVLSVIGAAATIPLLAAALQTPASAARTDGSAAPGADKAPAARTDDRPHPLERQRRQEKQAAVALVLKGKREVQNRGGSKAVRLAPGKWAEYGTESSDQIFTTLVEFGEQKGRGKLRKLPAGPLHNQIPQPDRSVDNTTYWKADFDRQHYMDMFFNGLADQNGESVKALYEEMSSGRYTIGGDVGDWVQVPYHEARYGESESNADMTAFIQDGANAWYQSQLAAGKSAAEIRDYLSTFDQWDRYDHDGDGDFAESDGYIDHYQAIHAGEGEEAGAPTWTIWSHRWYANQAGRGEVGPSQSALLGGVEIGNTGIWIGDYTTEPENGGIGVFAHEYAHDLGLPDLYDTSGGENGTGFWTLMSSGSWLGHGGDTIGTTPNHMGAWEKLQLGWLDYDVAQAGTASTHELGTSHQASRRPQALVVELPNDGEHERFYIAENRQYLGYDRTLAEGPYNFGWTQSKPNWVEHFPYQNGLLVTYWNTAYARNNTAVHPGAGLVLPVDAHPQAQTWSDGTVVRNRLQTYDATFGLEATDPLQAHRETALGMTTLSVPSQPGVAVFDDSDPDRYYDPANPQGSVRVAGTGTQIRVVDQSADSMTLAVE
jgi:M6 family metalloprotease-like protein